MENWPKLPDTSGNDHLPKIEETEIWEQYVQDKDALITPLKNERINLVQWLENSNKLNITDIFELLGEDDFNKLLSWKFSEDISVYISEEGEKTDIEFWLTQNDKALILESISKDQSITDPELIKFIENEMNAYHALKPLEEPVPVE